MVFFRKTAITDVEALLELYQGVAEVPGGLARLQHEISREYIHGFVEKTLATGIGLVAVNSEDERIVGELHAYSPNLFCFEPVLSDLTVAVDPHFAVRASAKLWLRCASLKRFGMMRKLWLCTLA
ncbi:hypothetical protein [Thiomicrorhabdus sp.]|uniref:hypothetical protein n=1 Tax=Thiomicrorhabdus sp. TaxID=2039724 RepID=UPI0029C9817A|nr:hypothetical protein [Thiomicrorhabdus sp.]